MALGLSCCSAALAVLAPAASADTAIAVAISLRCLMVSSGIIIGLRKPADRGADIVAARAPMLAQRCRSGKTMVIRQCFAHQVGLPAPWFAASWSAAPWFADACMRAGVAT